MRLLPARLAADVFDACFKHPSGSAAANNMRMLLSYRSTPIQA
jgi:hypothetical protein